MPRVLRRPQAEADVLEIWDYIADDSVPAADRWLDGLDEQFRLLASQPMMGRTRDELFPGVRSFPVGRYMVFYVPIEDGIDVVRVLHGARDIDAVFGSEPWPAGSDLRDETDVRVVKSAVVGTGN